MDVKISLIFRQIRKEKLSFYGHVQRHSTLERNTKENRVNGKRLQGRPRRLWKDYTKRWLQMNVWKQEDLPRTGRNTEGEFGLPCPMEISSKMVQGMSYQPFKTRWDKGYCEKSLTQGPLWLQSSHSVSKCLVQKTVEAKLLSFHLIIGEH